MEKKITIKNNNNEEKEFDILFTFTSKETKKEYVTYTAYEKDEHGNIKCYSSLKDGDKLLPVTTEKELDAIDEILKEIVANTKVKYNINKD